MCIAKAQLQKCEVIVALLKIIYIKVLLVIYPNIVFIFCGPTYNPLHVLTNTKDRSGEFLLFVHIWLLTTCILCPVYISLCCTKQSDFSMKAHTFIQYTVQFRVTVWTKSVIF